MLSPLGLSPSFGFGDRLGLATPGHIIAVKGTKFAPIFAQQSVRENTRTGRTPQQVMDDAKRAVESAKWDSAWGADADHLKTVDDLPSFVNAGYTFFTVDPGEHVDNADTDSIDVLKQKVAALDWDELSALYLLGNSDQAWGQFEAQSLMRATVKYSRAVQHAVSMFKRLSEMKDAFDFEMSVDETALLVKMAGAYGVFGTQGVYFGQEVGDAFEPVSVLKVEAADGSVWLDWTSPQTRPVVSSALAYLMTNALSDESVRWPGLGNPNVTEIGRPAAVKLGGTQDGLDAWTVGYTPARAVAIWTGTHDQSLGVTPRVSAVLWSTLMQLSTQSFTPDGWAVPAGVTVINVCDPSGMLPTPNCPNVVSEVFANGNEPVQTDNLYRKFSINRETGFLATVFTPPQLVEERVYLIVPPEARDWAKSAGLQVPPDAYDAIQPSPRNPDVNISAPAMFDEVNGTIRIAGTASGADFLSYRILAGQGLNPQKWIQVGEGQTAVVDGLLAEWDTSKLSGLYAVQLQVVRSDQRVDSAVIQVTIK